MKTLLFKHVTNYRIASIQRSLRLFLYIGIFMLSLGLRAQTVIIPDPDFLQALQNHSPAIDANKDGLIQVSEAKTVDILYASFKSIKSLKGIEAFTSLTVLYCSNNDLSELDLSANPLLTELDCSYNKLKELDVSSNMVLNYLDCSDNKIAQLKLNKSIETLFCGNNKLTELNVSNNVALHTLLCSENKLSTLDLSNNLNLTKLACNSNALNTLDLSRNIKLNVVSCFFNPDLRVICINPMQANMATKWLKDDIAFFSTSCSISTDTEEETTEKNNKIILRVLTMMGQEIAPEQAVNGVYIYQYTDGSTQKIAK